MLTGVKVIIVEDSFVVAHSLGCLLEGFGCEVVGKAANVQDACVLAENAEFDVAILDINLGGVLVTEVARKTEAKGARIVYLTGFSGPDLLPEDLRSHRCLAKPVRADDLVAAILGT